MPDWANLLSEWTWDPSIWIGVALLIGLYLAATGRWRTRFAGSRPRKRSQTILFLISMLVLWFALVSPLDTWGDEYLQSAHMLQHMLLTLVVPPFFILGLPDWLVHAAFQRPALRKIGRILTHPVLAYSIFNITFMAWHIPNLYEAALLNENIHIVEHLAFIVTGVLNWWPIFSTSRDLPPIGPGFQILYLFLEGIPTTVLTAIIVFAPDILYPTYANAPRVFGISSGMDQQIAGLEMGALGMVIYLAILTLVFYRWMSNEDSRERSQQV